MEHIFSQIFILLLNNINYTSSHSVFAGMPHFCDSSCAHDRWCERCNGPSQPEFRYILSLAVKDHTTEQWLTAFQVGMAEKYTLSDKTEEQCWLLHDLGRMTKPTGGLHLKSMWQGRPEHSLSNMAAKIVTCHLDEEASASVKVFAQPMLPG